MNRLGQHNTQYNGEPQYSTYTVRKIHLLSHHVPASSQWVYSLLLPPWLRLPPWLYALETEMWKWNGWKYEYQCRGSGDNPWKRCEQQYVDMLKGKDRNCMALLKLRTGELRSQICIKTKAPQSSVSCVSTSSRLRTKQGEIERQRDSKDHRVREHPENRKST